MWKLKVRPISINSTILSPCGLRKGCRTYCTGGRLANIGNSSVPKFGRHQLSALFIDNGSSVEFLDCIHYGESTLSDLDQRRPRDPQVSCISKLGSRLYHPMSLLVCSVHMTIDIPNVIHWIITGVDSSQDPEIWGLYSTGTLTQWIKIRMWAWVRVGLKPNQIATSKLSFCFDFTNK
jgi:hypothetical protein